MNIAPSKSRNKSSLSRRNFAKTCSGSIVAFSVAPLLGYTRASTIFAAEKPSFPNGPETQVLSLHQDWLFGGKLDDPAALSAAFDDSRFARITLPHCATKLSWQDWNWEGWQHVWCYRRHFRLPQSFKGQRVFLEFDGVMVGAEPTVNGHTLPKHLGGYLPFHYEITDHINDGDNVLAVAVDSRWSNVPPQGSDKVLQRVDYLEPGGIHRPIRLRGVPQTFISDVFAKPTRVLEKDRAVEVLCSLDAAIEPTNALALEIELRDGARVISRVRHEVAGVKPGATELALTLTNLSEIKLWDIDTPHLYQVVATLLKDGRAVHDYRVRIGFRDARFTVDGFFLNGRRLQIFGLNRHELYPYVGYAMPPRVKRRDAQILKHELNVNFVRCSHYPQSPDFLDACDELGLLVWQEVPGWGYIGDADWKDLLVRDAKDMIIRDRNRPSIVIWGTRANETANDEELYQRTRAMAKSLDGSRPTSGSMTSGSRKGYPKDWHEEVFAFDDYHAAPDHTVGIEDPAPGVPYMLAEAVGQYNYATAKGFTSYYRRTGDAAMQPLQALRHAQAHSKAAGNPRICGVVAWCGFEYGSLVNAFHRVKYPGVADIFRIPKLGATFYLAQCDPKERVVLEPDFYWDFGTQTPRGPGNNAPIFSNCDRLEVFINRQHHASLRPDTKNYPNLKHAPFFADLDLDGSSHPELRIDGYLGNKLAASRSFSSDPARDQFALQADDLELVADGVDATRLIFKVVDKFGANRAFADGNVSFEVSGPGIIVGDNPFSLTETGGIAAVWIKTIPNQPGRITVKATHRLGPKSVTIQVRKPGS